MAIRDRSTIAWIAGIILLVGGPIFWECATGGDPWDKLTQLCDVFLAVAVLAIPMIIGLLLGLAVWATTWLWARAIGERGTSVLAAIGDAVSSNKLRIAGAIWLAVWGLFLWHEMGNPLNELALIRRAQVTTGSLVDSYEAEQGGNQDRVYFSDVGVYAYRLSNGREFKTTTRVPTGQLEDQKEVEYLPDNPAVSRVVGDGCQTVMGWLGRKVIGGGFLLVLFAAPGIAMLLNRSDYLTDGGPSI